MKAAIYLDVPEWQIGKNVTVYFPDTMMKRGKCEAEKIETVGEKSKEEPMKPENRLVRISDVSEAINMSEFVKKISDYDKETMIETECIGCGKAIHLGYSRSALVPRLCDECKEAIKFAKKLMTSKPSKLTEYKIEIIDAT